MFNRRERKLNGKNYKTTHTVTCVPPSKNMEQAVVMVFNGIVKDNGCLIRPAKRRLDRIGIRYLGYKFYIESAK